MGPLATPLTTPWVVPCAGPYIASTQPPGLLWGGCGHWARRLYSQGVVDWHQPSQPSWPCMAGSTSHCRSGATMHRPGGETGSARPRPRPAAPLDHHKSLLSFGHGAVQNAENSLGRSAPPRSLPNPSRAPRRFLQKLCNCHKILQTLTDGSYPSVSVCNWQLREPDARRPASMSRCS